MDTTLATRPNGGELLEVNLDGATRQLKTFPRLSGNSFQHPDDRTAGNAIQGIPLFKEIFGMINGSYLDQKLRMEHLTYNLRVGPQQGAELYKQFVTACQILDLKKVPELYLYSHPSVDAYSVGINDPIVALSQGCLTQLSDAERMAVIGHELGHIKCQHGFNKSLGFLLTTAGVSSLSTAFPVVGVAALYGAKAAISHWCRMAEFSCDRAATLVVQDSKIVASVLSKIAGFHKSVIPDFNTEALYSQLADYDQYDQNTFQSLVKLQKLVVDAIDGNWFHPSPVLRVKRILDWGQSDQYNDILEGNYELEAALALPPPITGGLKCASCGNPMALGAKFCSRCGNPMK